MLQNYCARRNCVTQGFRMLIYSCVNSASSSFRALFQLRSLRFSTRCPAACWRKSEDGADLASTAGHGTDARRVQPVHDIRVVRAPEEPRDIAMVYRGAGKLGHRAVRISVPGAGKPHRLYRTQPRTAENTAGSHHAVGVRAVRGAVHEPAVEMELSVCGAVPDGGGVFYFQCVNF